MPFAFLITIFRSFFVVECSLSGLSGLHLMQQHNLGGNSDMLSTRTRTRSNDTKTPPHTEMSKYGNADRNEKPLRNATDQLKSLSSKSNTANNNNNNNNNINSKESSVSACCFILLYLLRTKWQISWLIVEVLSQERSNAIEFAQYYNML